MDEQNSDESVQEWIARVRRARELVDRGDLDEVAGHNPQAIEKLAKVTSALGELSEGRKVEYLPGVDRDEAPDTRPTADLTTFRQHSTHATL
jgi:hypothetical protein